MSHGTFTKGDDVRVAQDVHERISLLFNGYAETPAEDLKGETLDKALDAAALPKTGTADEKRARLSTDKS